MNDAKRDGFNCVVITVNGNYTEIINTEKYQSILGEYTPLYDRIINRCPSSMRIVRRVSRFFQ